jgi:hypothetical protein
MPKFRKKPIVIEAIQFTGDNFDELWCWTGGWIDQTIAGEDRYLRTLESRIHLAGSGGDPTKLVVETPEGDHFAGPGDWIIRGIRGEFYPCKPDIFEATYEAVEDAQC